MPRPNPGAYLSAKPNAKGYYEIRWTQGGRSKRLTTGTSDPRKAQQAFAQFLGRPGFLDEDEPIPTIAAILDTYIEEKVCDFMGDQVAVISNLMHLRAELGHPRADELTVGHTKKYVRDRAAGLVTWVD